MTGPSVVVLDRLARGSLWVSVGANASMAGVNLVLRHYEPAALQTILVAGMLAYLQVRRQYLDPWYAARLARAQAEQRTAELVASEMEKMRGARRVGISVTEESRSARMN